MSQPIAGNQYFTTLESNPKSHTILKSTTLKVGGTAYINTLEAKSIHNAGDLLVDGKLTVKDTSGLGSLFEKNLQVDGTLNVPSALSTLDSLSVTNASTLNGTLNVPSALSTLNSLSITNASTLNGTLNVPSALSTLDSLSVTNGSTLNGLTQVNGGITRQTLRITASGTTLTSAESDELITFSNAGGAYAIRLPPAVTSRGLKFRLTVGKAPLAANVTISAGVGDTLEGTILDGAATSVAVSGLSVDATASTVLGDFVEVFSMGGTQWLLSGVSRVAGAIA